MKRKILIVLSWTLTALCMLAIFLLSAQPADDSARLSEACMGPVGRIITALFGEAGHNVFRKLAHFFEYTGLSLLMYNAFFQTKKENRFAPFAPFLVCVLYAVSDEVHQLFVEGRACRLFDVGVDALGVITGMLIFFATARLCSFVKNKSNRK